MTDPLDMVQDSPGERLYEPELGTVEPTEPMNRTRIAHLIGLGSVRDIRLPIIEGSCGQGQ